MTDSDMAEMDAVAPRTLTGLLQQQLRLDAERPALIYGEQPLSFAELDDLAGRAATALAELGIDAGDRLAFWLPNSPAYLVLYLACARLGAIAVAVNTRFRAAEVGDILERSGARAMVLWPGFRGIDFLGLLEQIPAHQLRRLETVVVYAEGEAGPPALHLEGKGLLNYAELVAAPYLAADAAQPDSPCNIFTTSGTTRAPKFVLHRQAGIVRHGQDVWRNLAPLVQQGCLLQTLPLCGIFGFNHFSAALAGGRPLLLTSSFDARQAVELIDRYQVSYLSASDDMILAMLVADDREPAMPSLTCCGYAAFNMAPEEVAARAETRGLKLVGLYGMSEVQALFARRDHELPFAERYLPGGELVSAQARVRVRDPDSGRLLDHGESGELEFAGPSLMLEYFEDPEATRSTLTQDGYLRSGDLGHTTDARNFVFEARMGDTLRLGGYLVSPAEIEGLLLEHPQVAAAQVVAVRVGDAMKPCAFIIPAPGASPDPEALRLHCADNLAAFKVPVAFHRVAEFPTTRSANGTKIQRARLRDMAQQALTQSGGGALP